MFPSFLPWSTRYEIQHPHKTSSEYIYTRQSCKSPKAILHKKETRTLGLYSAFRACRAIVFNSKRQSIFTVETMFLHQRTTRYLKTHSKTITKSQSKHSQISRHTHTHPSPISPKNIHTPHPHLPPHNSHTLTSLPLPRSTPPRIL